MNVRVVDQSRLAGAPVVVRLVSTEEVPVAPLTAKEFSGAAGALAVVPNGARRIVLAGVGSRAGAGALETGRALGAAIRQAQASGVESLVVDCGPWAAHARRLAEAAVMAGYQFDVFLPESRRLKTRVSTLELAVPAPAKAVARRAAETGAKIGHAANYARSLGDLPGNVVTPEALADSARELAARHRNLRVTVWDEAKLRTEGCGGLLAVGGGSANAPRLIVLEYRGGRAGEAPVALVGKAITFDSGGLSIKPADRMDEMKFDKMGGCAVLGVMAGLAALGVKCNVTAVIAAAENLTGSHSYRPGDIVTAYDGQTIEVLNTDAEGRIVLADALSYARRHVKPACIVDYATLTGACVVALGNEFAGLFANDAALAKALRAAGAATGERVWELPRDAAYQQAVRSEVATVKNTGGRWGGACTAAAFLETWVDAGTPWAHLDIAGTAWLTDARPHLARGATGFGVRLTLEWLLGRRVSA
jgi:leucyl aminopeptidase